MMISENAVDQDLSPHLVFAFLNMPNCCALARRLNTTYLGSISRNLRECAHQLQQEVNPIRITERSNGIPPLISLPCRLVTHCEPAGTFSMEFHAPSGLYKRPLTFITSSQPLQTWHLICVGTVLSTVCMYLHPRAVNAMLLKT